jgi:hypothetical protein
MSKADSIYGEDSGSRTLISALLLTTEGLLREESRKNPLSPEIL